MSSSAVAAKYKGPVSTGVWCAAAAALAPRRPLPDLQAVGWASPLFAVAAAAGADLALAFALALALYFAGFP